MRDFQRLLRHAVAQRIAFDVSAAIPPDSWYGTLLKGVLNFSPQTTVLEAVERVVDVDDTPLVIVNPEITLSEG